jgi:uncharacterized protein (TIGR02271 family)
LRGADPPRLRGGNTHWQHRLTKPKPPNASATGDSVETESSLPIIEETATLRTRRIDTGSGVRVSKTVTEREEIIDEPLERDELVIERVAIDRIVDSEHLPTVRYEGDVMIVPVLEEIIVAEKRTVLKEEVRITRLRRQVREPQRVSLRSEEVSTERFDEGRKSRTPELGDTAEPTAGDTAGFTRPLE